MYAVDSRPCPNAVLAHTKFAFPQATFPEEHPELKVAPVQNPPFPPYGLPPHIPVTALDVIKSHSSFECTAVKQEFEPGLPDPVKAAHADRAEA